ncbi:hypothetical protein LRP88_00214 [Fusarium phalaenopsidis]
MNDAQQSLKRRRSLTSEDINPPAKVQKPDVASNDSGLKRPRSPSSADGGPPAERPRLSAESTLVEPEDKDEEPLEIGGLQVYNIRQALVGAHGEEFPLPASNTEKEDNLPTPSAVLGRKSPLAKSLTASVAFVGDTKLLRFIPAKIYIYQSAATTKALHSQPYTEIVRVTGTEKLSLGTFVPTLAGSGWDIIQLVDPKLGFVETTNGLLDDRGLFFETDLVFTGALQPVSNFLRDFFRQKEPGIRFSAGLAESEHLTGSIVPLQVDYKLRKILSVWELELCLKNDDWVNVMGIEGLALSEVMLISRLDGSDPKISKLTFDVTALMQLRSATMQVRGFYSKEHMELSVFLGNLTLRDVGEIFYELTKLPLYGAVTINGHTSIRGSLKLSKDGIEVRGAIGDIAFDDWDLLIREAGFDVFIASKMKGESARSTKVSISGDVSFHGIDACVALFTEKHPKLGWVWTVYGEVSGDLSTSRLVPALKGNSMLDISLKRLAIIASSRDAAAGTLQGVPFSIVKGVQLCASIDSIAAIEALLGGSVKGMVLRAAYTNGAFALGISLPAARTIRFSDTIWTGPIELSILADPGVPSPKLVIAAVLNFQVDGQPDDMPLQLELTLGADLIGATASAKMLTPWVNPFDAGKNVVIKTCVMEIGIIYTSFIASGTPGSLAFGGQLAIGSKTAGATFKFSQNPKEQLVDIFVEDLGASDLMNFASLVADRELPTVADDLLHFTKLNMYFSTGTTIGKDVYPPGISAKGDLKVFGATKRDPLVDIEFSAQAQKILIDGAVDIWDASAALHLDIGLLPKATFDFFVYLKLSDLFLLKLKGTIDIKDYKTWANTDFAMYGLMEQRVIDYVTAQLDQQILAAHEAAKEGFEIVKQDLEAKEAVLKAGCDDAIKKLEIAKAVWLAKKAQVDSGFANASASAAAERKRLLGKVDETERDFKKTVSDELKLFELAKRGLAEGERATQALLDTAQKAVDELSDCVEFIGFETAKKGVQLNTKELNLARHAVEIAEDAVELELDLAKWAPDHVKNTFNIRKVEFSGSVRSLVHPDEGGPPLRVKIEGTILGEETNWEIVWKPKFDLVKFIKELFTLLWEKIQEGIV